MTIDLKSIQLEYHRKELLRDSLKDTPNEQLNDWMQDMIHSKVPYPNAVNISTVGSDGLPHSRIVLIKDITEAGLTFFTNYRSAKAKQIENNSFVCVNFFWKEADRQVRVLAKASKLNYKESNEYFLSRSMASQINAIASPQSQKITKEELEQKVQDVKESNQEIVCPHFWGGYLLEIINCEFWQGRPNRLHDRFFYEMENNNWKISRLAP